MNDFFAFQFYYILTWPKLIKSGGGCKTLLITFLIPKSNYDFWVIDPIGFSFSTDGTERNYRLYMLDAAKYVVGNLQAPCQVKISNF